MHAQLAKTAHTEQPWRIHELLPDFDLYDVWALPTPGAADDFPTLFRVFYEGDLARNPSAIFRGLFALRWKIGAVLGWDKSKATAKTKPSPLSGRLPLDLASSEAPNPLNLPFTSLYLTDTEWAAEMSNKTSHGIMHIGWVPDENAPGRYRGQMAVLVKPNGWAGRFYMALIAPFRHLLVYPALTRTLSASWLERTAPSAESAYTWAANGTYSDTITLARGSDLPARWWVSTMFEKLITPAGRETVFRVVLGLRPARGPATLIDWHIAEETQDVIRLERSSPLMSCRLTAATDSGSVRLSLVVEPRNKLGAAVWRKASPLHRKMGASLLRRAANQRP